MYPAPIARYERPSTIAEALEAMAGAGEGALYLAGGTAAMPAVNARALRPCALVDLGGVEELDGIAKGPRGVAIRPMTRLGNLAGVSALHGAHQAIADAAATMGDRQVRNAGTIGGGLFWKGGAACMATAALCLDAVLALRSPGGAERALPASAFVAHPAGADGGGRELLVEIRLPRAEPDAASAYKKAATGAGGPPLAGVAASIKVDAEGLCSDARLAVGGLAPSARLFEGAAALLCGGTIDEARADAAAAAAADALAPASGGSCDSRYRQALVRSLGRAVIERAYARARDRVFGGPLP